MEKIIENTAISFEQALEMPEMADFHEAIRFVEANPNAIFFPKKFEANLVDTIEEEVEVLHQQQPNLPLRDVLTTILSDLSEDISGDLLIKATKTVVKYWKNLAAKHHNIYQELEPA